MFDHSKPWYGLRGGRRAVVRVLTLMAVVLGILNVVSWVMVIVAVALPAGGFGRWVAQMDPVSGIALSLFGLWLVFALVALIVTLVAWKGMKMSHRVVASTVTVALWGVVILGAAAMVPGGPTIGPPTATALQYTFIPSVDTTASYPAGSFTACTSQNILTSNGAKTAAGVVWSAISAGLGAQYTSTGPTSGTFLMQTGDQTPVTGGGGKMSASCYQMKITWQYTNAPPASGGGSVYFPVFVYLTGVQYSAPSANLNTAAFDQAYNNGTTVHNPVFGNQYVGLNAFPVLVKDAGGSWLQVCPNLQNVNVQYMSSLPACQGINVNTSPTSNSITFTVIFDTSAFGLFGYATTDAAVGSSLTLSFSAGLPSSQALPGYQGYYTPTMSTWNLIIQRTAA